MKHFLSICAALCFTLTACNDFLDKNPDPTKRVPTSLEDIDRLSNFSRNDAEASYDSGGDEYFIPVFNANFSEAGREFYKTWNYGLTTPWAMMYEITDRNYKSIQNANASLELLEKIPVTDVNRQLFNKIKGKCHYLRASNYMFLAWAYCNAYHADRAATDLGMPIDEDSYFGNKLRRSTLQELYDYILKEAQMAYELLELRYPIRDEINKINTMGLLARIHLSMRQYEEAFYYSNELLLHESDLMNYNNPDEVAIGSATVFKNFNREMLEILPNGFRQFIEPVITSNWNQTFIDTNLIASYAPNDLRLPAYFAKEGDYYRYGGSLYGVTQANNIMMVDEFYLIRAECYARQGDRDKALKDLNDLLVTRFVTGTFIPYAASSAEVALDIILEERRKSLVLRGLRWIDIKRLNLEDRNISVVRKVDGVTYTLPPNDPRFARPLHTVLVGDYGYEQNPY